MTVIACVFLSFILAMTVFAAITGIWPPFMAVESKSMQHSENASDVGIIDTGDIVVARRLSGPDEIRTYVGSIADGYRSFGEYGDVIIYQPPDGSIPIVHRAICEVVYNGCGGFDVPELSTVPADLWSSPGEEGRWRGLTDTLDLFGVGYQKATVHIDLAALLESMGSSPHGGLITMGDNNGYSLGGERFGVIDQGSIVEGPIPWEWVVGKVTGEIPWVGSLRLWATGTAPDYLPRNSVVMLGVSVAALIALPVVIYLMASLWERRAERKGRGGR
jgi:signal peptidase